MATPTVNFQISSAQFVSLIRVLRAEMNQHLDTIDRSDRHEVRLFEMNYWLMIDWITKADKAADKSQLKVKIDLMYAKAFIEYWSPVSLPMYEETLLRKAIVNLNRSIDIIAAKRGFINL